jgi:hypothetical protein
MRSLIRLTLGMGLAALAASPAAAQTRDGFFVGLGAGYGWAKLDCDDCLDLASERESALTGQVRLGTTLTDRVSVGVEMNGWFDSEGDDSVSLFNVTGAFYLYPADSGLFIKAGAGLSRADFDLGGEDLSGLGWGVMAGVGYDFPIGDSSAVTPTATFWYGKPGDLQFEDIPVLSGFKHNVFEIGVGVTFY